MVQDFTEYYFICAGESPIGVIRIVSLQNGLRRIAPMFILPEHQGKGYAQQAILAAEALYPNAAGWELGTVKQEEKLRYLYEKMGYRPTGQEENIQDGMTIIYYAKQASAAAAGGAAHAPADYR